MEDDVDIYADLPSFNLNPEKNDQDCNCKELRKELSSLISKLENIQKIKTNLENNLSSLLKTARAEITRKDKMIDELRKRLDDVTFRRSHKYESLGFSINKRHQHIETRKYENVPLMQSQESETESYQIQFYYDEYKNKKSQNDVNRIPTVFGKRLHKRIMENEKEEKKKKALKLNVETKIKDISKENIVENDTENGSQFSINNNDNKSIIGQCSSSESSYRKNLKRTNEENDTRRHKRIKIENNEDKVQETDYNYLTRYDLTDNSAQHEMKDNLEDRLDASHSFQKEEVLFYERRATSEYRDTKQDRRWKSEAKSNSAKDHDSSNIKNSHADNLRNSRIASMSNHISERYNSGYKKNRYKYSPSRRSYSRSRSDYESSSNRLRERSNKIYRKKKYDDKYDSRYKNSRSKGIYESEENDRKTRYRHKEHGDLRDKSKYSSSDTEDKESNSSYKNKKYENRRIKKETASVLNNKKYESNKTAAETNLRESSSRTIVNNTINYRKNIEQHKVNNELEIKSINLTESTSAHMAKKNLDISDISEEGEILDSPEKKNNSAKISTDNKMEENNLKIIPVEDKNEDISRKESIDDKSIPLQNDANSTKQLEADISTNQIEVASHLLQENSKDCGEIIQLNCSKNNMAVDEVHNCIKDDECKSHINEDLIDSTIQNIGITEQVRDSDINDNNKNDADKRSKDSEIVIKIKETTDSNFESVTKIKELDDFNIESVANIESIKKEKISNSNIESVDEITKVNNFNNDSIQKIDDDELRNSTSKITKMEVVLNCDIEERNKSQAPIEKETFHQISNKSDIEMYLNDHNYVQNPFINVSDLDEIQKSSLKSEHGETVLETTTSKEIKAKEIINVQSVGVKKTLSSVVKNKEQQSKGILISHRRKAVILSDSNASMTVLMNTNIAKTSSIINNCNDNDSTLKPRACKTSRVTAKATCK